MNLTIWNCFKIGFFAGLGFLLASGLIKIAVTFLLAGSLVTL